MSVDIGDIFLEATCRLRGIELYLNDYLARSDVEPTGETEER
jgi:hypothetical protein